MQGVVYIYIDDILIYTKSLEKHCKVTQEVLKHLWKHQLFLKLEKCKFECLQIKYLSIIISEGYIEMDLVKVKGVK